ncbi:MAG: hypothetical protein M3Q30_12130 [Actinomycetota bacterium]|nr:hypothetical protein [Actinomycetota bacterium]
MPLLALPPCDSDGNFLAWAATAVAPYHPSTITRSSRIDRLPLRDVADLTPVIVDPSPFGCILAGRFNQAIGWERRDAHGTVVARAVSIPGGRTVPARMLSHPSSYHQEAIGSGQAINGFIEGDTAEALIAGRITVLSIPGLHATTYQAGVALEQRLNLYDLINTTPTIGQPTRMVPGMQLCATEPTPEYCDGTGRRLTVGRTATMPTTGQKITINGQASVVIDGADGTRYVTVQLGFPGVFLQATGTPDITLDRLVAVIRSVPVLTPGYLHPASGTRDLRASFSPDWLRRNLEAISARNVKISAPPGFNGSPTGFLDARFTAKDSTAGYGTFGAQTPRTLPVLATRIVKIGTAQFWEVGTTQTLGYCNDIFVNIQAPNATAIASAFVHQIGC